MNCLCVFEICCSCCCCRRRHRRRRQRLLSLLEFLFPSPCRTHKRNKGNAYIEKPAAHIERLRTLTTGLHQLSMGHNLCVVQFVRRSLYMCEYIFEIQSTLRCIRFPKCMFWTRPSRNIQWLRFKATRRMLNCMPVSFSRTISISICILKLIIGYLCAFPRLLWIVIV